MIANGWKISKQIGCGTFGFVHEASKHEIEGEWVVKIANKNYQQSSEDLLWEYTIYSKYLNDCKFIPKVIECGEFKHSDGRNYKYLVMEKLQYNLSSIDVKVLSFENVIRIVRQILNGLEVLHSKQLVHRDLKPENIFINTDGSVYLIDFGSTRSSTQIRYSEGGSLNYMSRHCHNCLSPQPRDDLESLCYVMIYLLSGKLPWPPGKQNLINCKFWITPAEINKFCDLNSQQSIIFEYFFNYIRELSRSDIPDYKGLHELLDMATNDNDNIKVKIPEFCRINCRI